MVHQIFWDWSYCQVLSCHVGARNGMDPLEEQPVRLTSELSLQCLELFSRPRQVIKMAADS